MMLRLRGLMCSLALLAGGVAGPASAIDPPPAERDTRLPPAPAASPAARPAPRPAPRPTASPTAAATATSGVRTNAITVPAATHIVRPGETLRGIGNRTGAGAEAIARANRLTPPYGLRDGQRLVIPAGRYHSVAEGQTGIAIARAYGVRWQALIDENALVSPYVLRVGQRLRIPGNGAIAGNGGRIAAPAASPSPSSSPTASPSSATTPLRWPLEGRIINRFTTRGSGNGRNGIDIAATPGTRVNAAAAGRVLYAGDDVERFGRLVLIDHGAGRVTAYGYLRRISVRVGDRLRAGQQLGQSGRNASASNGAAGMLHFELRQNRRPVDPLPQLPVR